MDNREGKHGYDYRAEAERELALADISLGTYHVARAQVYATLAVSAQMADDEWWRSV